MEKLIAFFMAISMFVSGHFIQADIRIHPEKYNLITLDTSELPEPINSPEVDDFVQLSEVRMHYLVFGHGKYPLILIHGNGGSTSSLYEAATYLANDYTVYVTDSRCHGQSSDPGVISYELMAKDIVEFGNALGISKPVIMGHSDGGMIAITIAAEYPDFPQAIISCGSNSDPSTFWPYFRIGVRFNDIGKNDKLNEMMLTLPHWTAEYLSQIKCDTYVVCGEYDIMKPQDSLFIHESIEGSDFAMIKGADHGSYMSRDGKQAYILASNWLNSKYPDGLK